MTVSVIIPTYNRADLIPQTIDSVLRQTYHEFEIIIIDDGSTDNTEAIIKGRYSDKVTYIKQSNMGVNAARNRAIEFASGKYIALLDSDDLWLDFKLELQVGLLDYYTNIGFIFSDFFILKNNTTRIPAGLHTWHSSQRNWDSIFPRSDLFSNLNVNFSGSLHKGDFHIYSGDIYYHSLFGPYVLPSTAIIRRDCLDPDLRFVEEDSTCGDWDFFSRLSHRHHSVFMDIETTLNRSHEDEVRLTRVNPITQTQRRIGLINRVWKSDNDFYKQYKNEVLRVEKNELFKLAKHQLHDSDIRSARISLAKLRDEHVWTKDYKIVFLTILSILPGASLAIRGVNYIKKTLRNIIKHLRPDNNK